MVKALTTGTRLRVVREVHEDESGAAIRFQQGGQGHLALGDANYATHLRLARRSQERQHPVGVTFGEGQTITEIIRADNDVPSHLWEEEPGQARVLFQGHDGVFRLRPDHPESARLRAELGESLRQKARVWFIAQKPDLALLDVLPAGQMTAASPRRLSGAIEITDYLDVGQRASDLGIKAPEGACILPRGFARAKNARELVHESSALDLKTLFREADLPITAYQPDGVKIPYLQENDITWVGPALFFSAAAISQNPHIVSVALSVIANYVTDLFKGLPQPARVKLSVVVETHNTKTTTTVTKKIDFDGPPDKLSEINGLIKDIK
jgi:hypothetical protein